MATTAQNLFLYDIGSRKAVPYPILSDGTNDINQGDALYYDTAAKVAKVLDSDAHAQYFIGIADDSSYINPYGTKKYAAAVIAREACVVNRYTTAGDTYNDGDALYMGADAQTVTNTAGGMTHPIGYVKLLPGSSAIVGGTGVVVPMRVVAVYPVSPLA